jgi:hypothetical protein
VNHRRRADTFYIAGGGLVVVSLVFAWTHVFSTTLASILGVVGIVIALLIEPIICIIKGEG